jgi:hypothetical protein
MFNKFAKLFKNSRKSHVDCGPTFTCVRRPDEGLAQFIKRSRLEADAFFANFA